MAKYPALRPSRKIRAFAALADYKKLMALATGRRKKGFVTVVFEGGASARAEVHWYEAHGIGKMEMKIKEFI